MFPEVMEQPVRPGMSCPAESESPTCSGAECVQRAQSPQLGPVICRIHTCTGKTQPLTQLPSSKC